MTNELVALFDYYEKEKGIDRMTMVEALSGALLSASKKSIGPARELRIDIDPDKGVIKAIARLLVVDKVSAPYDEINLATARRINPDAQLEDEVEVEVTPKDFGRIAAQTAKQAMMQRLRQAEKAMIYEEFKDRAGEIVNGVVRRFEKSDVIVDLGKFEGIMPSRERVQTEDYAVGDRLRAYVVAVDNGARGPEIVLSRSHPNFVRRLFEVEVSEIADRTVEIRSIAREAGYRTKVAVHSIDDKVDPVGACVGMRGARVKNIVRELNSEKVDIIRWYEDPEEFVKDALRPVQVRSIQADPERKRIRVTVADEELSKAIGRRGQNARLTSRLIGWDVQIDKDESAHEALVARIGEAAELLRDELELTNEVAAALATAGATNIDALLSMEVVDITDVTGIDEASATDILSRARAKAGVDNGDGGDAATAEAESGAEDAAEEAVADAGINVDAEAGTQAPTQTEADTAVVAGSEPDPSLDSELQTPAHVNVPPKPEATAPLEEPAS